MYQNHYSDEVDRWKVDLVLRRARRMGFRGHELEDVQQQLILEVAAFKFAPKQANGATEITALTALVDRQLLTLRRAKRRYENHLERLRAAHGVGRGGSKDGRFEPGGESRADMVFDVRDAVARLSTQQREVCLALSEGHSVAEIARRLGCGWHTVGREISRILDRFRRMGLDGWLES